MPAINKHIRFLYFSVVTQPLTVYMLLASVDEGYACVGQPLVSFICVCVCTFDSLCFLPLQPCHSIKLQCVSLRLAE